MVPLHRRPLSKLPVYFTFVLSIRTPFTLEETYNFYVSSPS